MATIKDVAKQAGVSVTTVSIIINGKSEERKISTATQQRVAEAMRDLGYQPNLSARRLRSQENERPVIAFFWPLDYRVSILASFLNFIQIEIAESGLRLVLVKVNPPCFQYIVFTNMETRRCHGWTVIILTRQTCCLKTAKDI